MARVVVIGSFNVDHAWRVASLPSSGETLGGTYASGPGGKGFNQATACVRAGVHTTFLCALGDDVGAQLARALAAADGIDLRDARSDAPTGTAGIFVDAQGRNSIVVAPGANAVLDAAFIARHANDIGAANAVLGQLETPADAIVHAFELARASGIATLLNPAPADATVTPRLLALSDILTPNETEFCAQLARHADVSVDADSLAARDDGDLHALCRRLHPDGSVVVTLGSAGCFVSHCAQQLRGDAVDHYRIAAEAVTPVDTTGAGDAFSGALAARLARQPQDAFQSHVRYANRYAALSTQRAGAAIAMPRDDDVTARFG
ncbi:ribokinase [Lysobacter fragariae]